MIGLGYKEAEALYKNNYSGDEPQFIKISHTEAFNEYNNNEDFRSVIDTDMFRYVDGYFIIDNEKYITVTDDGKYILTDYARKNLNECVLRFTYRRVNINQKNDNKKDILQRSIFDKQPQYESASNVSLIDNAEEMKKRTSEFESQYSEDLEFTINFWQLSASIIKSKGWDRAAFKAKTSLSDSTYRRIMSSLNEDIPKDEIYNETPKMQTVMAICIGFTVSAATTHKLLAVAGCLFGESREHKVYSYLLHSLKGYSIDECNAFLEKLKMKPLTSGDRKSGNSEQAS